MKNDELILDVLEKIHVKVEKLDEKVDKIQVQQAIHDEVVRVHESRSTGLEGRVNRLEQKELMINGGVKVVLAIGALIAFSLKILSYL